MRGLFVLVGLAFVSLVDVARAQDGATPVDSAVVPIEPAVPGATVSGYADEYASRPLTLSGGMLQVKVPLFINLSKSAVAKPVGVPLEVRYGVSNELELRLFHETLLNPIQGVGGICIGGEERYCGKLYNNVGFGVAYTFLKGGALELAGVGALEIARLSEPRSAFLDLGVGVKYIAGTLSVTAVPQVFIRLNDRDGSDTNGETVNEVIQLPVELAFQASPRLAPFLRTGIVGPSVNFDSRFIVPLEAGANFLAVHGLDVGGYVWFPRVVSGRTGNQAFDARALMLYMAWRSR